MAARLFSMLAMEASAATKFNIQSNAGWYSTWAADKIIPGWTPEMGGDGHQEWRIFGESWFRCRFATLKEEKVPIASDWIEYRVATPSGDMSALDLATPASGSYMLVNSWNNTGGTDLLDLRVCFTRTVYVCLAGSPDASPYPYDNSDCPVECLDQRDDSCSLKWDDQRCATDSRCVPKEALFKPHGHGTGLLESAEDGCLAEEENHGITAKPCNTQDNTQLWTFTEVTEQAAALV